MSRSILITALTTGGFCSIFAVGVDVATEMLAWWQVLLAGGVSGFLGSLFANLVWKGRASQ